MTDLSLQLVLTLDAQSGRYTPAGHNLSPAKAAERIQKFQLEGVTATILNQDIRHATIIFRQCKLCKAATEQFATPTAASADQEKPEDSSTSVPAGEKSEAE